QAIQHAHQKGIIHRDLKPSNVMITLYDGKPVPKVIDFGVAKATEQKLTERTLFTQYGTMVGTLEYMSPEQAEMSALGVDTRSDDSANGFAADVQRYLNDEPVLACPPSVGYRLRKFARRYRKGLATAAAVAVLLIAGVIVSTWQAIRATHAEYKATSAKEKAE